MSRPTTTVFAWASPKLSWAWCGGERHPEGAGDLVVELVGNRSSDVVRLDDLVENGHGGGQVIQLPD